MSGRVSGSSFTPAPREYGEPGEPPAFDGFIDLGSFGPVIYD